MVDVSRKQPTVRTAEAGCIVKLNQEAYTKLKERQISKGDTVTIAEIAGI